MWDFDQRFKVLLDQVIFTISPAQHKEWFIAALLPHIRTPLMQQKVGDQQEALEIAMKLETAPVGDDYGIAQIQAQLAAMALELREMKKGKSDREEVWCTQCRTEGHDKEWCPLIDKYLQTSAPNSFPPQVLYCELCRMTGQHRPENCYLLQRYGQGPKNSYCKFCKSVGHNEEECRTYDAYRVHTEGPHNDSYGYQGGASR